MVTRSNSNIAAVPPIQPTICSSNFRIYYCLLISTRMQYRILHDHITMAYPLTWSPTRRRLSQYTLEQLASLLGIGTVPPPGCPAPPPGPCNSLGPTCDKLPTLRRCPHTQLTATQKGNKWQGATSLSPPGDARTPHPLPRYHSNPMLPLDQK